MILRERGTMKGKSFISQYFYCHFISYFFFKIRGPALFISYSILQIMWLTLKQQAHDQLRMMMREEILEV